MSSSQFKKAIQAINKNGALLVFPIKNAKEPNSIWREFHPRTPMRWEWDDSGDHKVSDMWHLMKKLSDCKEVVYSKWYQGRATFFSRELFQALLTISLQKTDWPPLSREARQILRQLEMNSPLSTKELKSLTHLQGKFYESAYNRALRELFRRFLIVGFGEVDDGAFPSLAVGATQLIYENIWNAALRDAEISRARADVQAAPTGDADVVVHPSGADRIDDAAPSKSKVGSAETAGSSSQSRDTGRTSHAWQTVDRVFPSGNKFRGFFEKVMGS